MLNLTLSGTSAAATAATTGSVATFKSTATGFTAATQTLVGIFASGANSNASVIMTGLTISVTNTGTTNTNVALTLTASGGSTANTALNITAGNVNIAATGQIKATSGVISFSVVSTALTQGSAGSIIIPVADFVGAANDAARDALAGNVSGAFGVDSAGGFIYVRVGTAWKKGVIA